ncbi:MAG: hypothetical protein JXO22_15065, partial [Phycisphaerae bacterium]|nr:hypothetical protein [Phycisphaerae bacterium]
MSTTNDPQPPMFPEMREMVAPEADPAQESLNRALQSGFNVLGLAMVVLALLYLASGVFQVESGKQGLIARFGKLRTNNVSSSEHYNTPIFDPGWHIALPDPFAEKISISNEVQTLAIDTFCF